MNAGKITLDAYTLGLRVSACMVVFEHGNTWSVMNRGDLTLHPCDLSKQMSTFNPSPPLSPRTAFVYSQNTEKTPQNSLWITLLVIVQQHFFLLRSFILIIHFCTD
ncbi:hypothetical protein ILYODFUR_004265 [Ilyodon furcidens]|uniref:Uncharacterized protein n=1 Tax=Ilyodon furcidens TaxID=33524 RepID=A0ABV0V326_9TELE